MILTSDTVANVYLVNRLLSRHDVAGIVVECPPPAASRTDKIARRRQMFRKHGALKTVNKLLLNWVRSRLLAGRDARSVRDALFPNEAEVRYQRNVDIIRVDNINDPRCGRFIVEHAPDVIAVCGTGVIKPEIFGLASRGAINIHTGITPEYRSADPILWALYNNQPEMIGVTIHFIDAGIDTGAIVCQQTVPIYREDTLSTIYARCIQVGSQLYLEALAHLARGSAPRIERHRAVSKAYYSINMGLFQYLVVRWRLARLRARLPQEPAHQ